MLFNRKKILKKPDEEAEKKLRENIANEGGLEKKDIPALIFSAYLVFIPICVGILLLLYFIGRLFLGF